MWELTLKVQDAKNISENNIFSFIAVYGIIRMTKILRRYINETHKDIMPGIIKNKSFRKSMWRMPDFMPICMQNVLYCGKSKM